MSSSNLNWLPAWPPPVAQPPRSYSLGSPGAWMTPSTDTNSVTTTRPIVNLQWCATPSVRGHSRVDQGQSRAAWWGQSRGARGAGTASGDGLGQQARSGGDLRLGGQRVAEQEGRRPLALGHAVAVQLVHADAELRGAQGHPVLVTRRGQPGHDVQARG